MHTQHVTVLSAEAHLSRNEEVRFELQLDLPHKQLVTGPCVQHAFVGGIETDRPIRDGQLG